MQDSRTVPEQTVDTGQQYGTGEAVGACRRRKRGYHLQIFQGSVPMAGKEEENSNMMTGG